MNLTFSHVGICVSDLERSMRFYCEGLGFEPAQAHTVGGEFGRLMELDDVCPQIDGSSTGTAGCRSKLLHFDSPGHSGGTERRPMNQLGITHLSLRVDDLDHVAHVIHELFEEEVVDEHTDHARSIRQPARLRLLHRPGRGTHRASCTFPIDLCGYGRVGGRNRTRREAPGPSRTLIAEYACLGGRRLISQEPRP